MARALGRGLAAIPDRVPHLGDVPLQGGDRFGGGRQTRTAKGLLEGVCAFGDAPGPDRPGGTLQGVRRIRPHGRLARSRDDRAETPALLLEQRQDLALELAIAEALPGEVS